MVGFNVSASRFKFGFCSVDGVVSLPCKAKGYDGPKIPIVKSYKHGGVIIQRTFSPDVAARISKTKGTLVEMNRVFASKRLPDTFEE